MAKKTAVVQSKCESCNEFVDKIHTVVVEGNPIKLCGECRNLNDAETSEVFGVGVI